MIIGHGGTSRTVQTAAIWGRGPEALARLEANNAAIQRLRCRIEAVPGTRLRSKQMVEGRERPEA
ncbi:hypothetical protein [Roseicella aerolata]|uniref:Uncharacterized protein n=1 Tax=Roseicella aerolata TaxID=2883479 RepID=A0A9X1IH52_9PROT|nr:hypothetical protein [Roseicella aerolata]MCB4824751.1 hypothetical protein [Roseicella aerolata]